MLFSSKKNKINKTIGYKKDQNGIINRHLREEGAWNTHLEKSKRFILDSVKSIEDRNRIWILGSGWWLDIPYNELSKMFEKVYLVDILHPKQIIHKAKKYKNIELIEADITNGASELVYEHFKINKNEKINLEILVPECKNFGIKDIEKSDVVVSLNILNQLDIILSDYINKFNNYSKTEIQVFKKEVQNRHIEALKKYNSILITDFEELIFNYNEELIKTKNLIFTEIPEGKNSVKWLWNFDLSGNYNKNKITKLNVIAVSYLK